MAARYINKEERKRKRRITVIIMVIIILLLLVRSCSKEFSWTIGRLFGTSSEHEITEESDDIIILNKNLKFNSKEEKITLNDKEYKIDFSYDLINPKEFTCATSDASVATCYVKDDYVIIKPKKTGNIEVFVETKTNNKVYKASMKLTVEDLTRSLTLSSKSGTIVLSKTNEKILTYNLYNIDGDIKVISSDESIATVKVKNGVITITAKKAGNCKITVSIIDKNSNKTYQVVYKLSVVNKASDIVNNGNTSSDSTSSSNPTTKPDTPSTQPTPGATDNPSDTDKPQETPTETNKPTVEKENNNYLNLIKVNNGNLSPEFNKNTLNYNVSVENNVSNIDVTIKKDSNKAKIKYTYNGNNITSLNNLSLNIGDNTLKIEVIAENNEKRVYTVIINRKQMDNVSNYLSSLSIDGYTLTPSFNKEVSFYSTNVAYNDKEISLNYTKDNSESSVTVTINNNQVTDLSNISLSDGDNRLEITVTDKNQNKRVYVVTIHKPVRTIEFYDNSYSMYIEQVPFNISYKILEDNVEINDYQLNDITVNIANFSGTYKLNKGYLAVTPSINDINKTFNIKLSYNNQTVSTQLTVYKNNYYITSPAYEYDIAYANNSGKKNIIINNNILTGTITKTTITNGFRLTSTNGAYIDVITNDNLVTVNYDSINSSNSSIVINVNALNSGTSTITVIGNIFNSEVKRYNIKLNIIDKYNVIIDANGGFFDAFSDKYTYLVESTDEIDLSEFDALKADDKDNCLFFKLDSFNTNSDGTGTKYNKTDVITNFTKDLTLYAIYTSTSSFVELEDNERLYLTEVDLFHNEEYYEKYNIDKIIYPGAEGAHVMSITNNSTNKISITGINLEEDTLCISSGKCLNIGYIIKSALNVNDPYTYFYGDNTNYQILNKDTNTTHTYGSLTGYHTENNISMNPSIDIEVGETKEISILWKWVEIDNDLDTKIGSSVSTIGNTYSLTVSIDFERVNNTCVLP